MVSSEKLIGDVRGGTFVVDFSDLSLLLVVFFNEERKDDCFSFLLLTFFSPEGSREGILLRADSSEEVEGWAVVSSETRLFFFFSVDVFFFVFSD